MGGKKRDKAERLTVFYATRLAALATKNKLQARVSTRKSESKRQRVTIKRTDVNNSLQNGTCMKVWNRSQKNWQETKYIPVDVLASVALQHEELNCTRAKKARAFELSSTGVM